MSKPETTELTLEQIDKDLENDPFFCLQEISCGEPDEYSNLLLVTHFKDTKDHYEDESTFEDSIERQIINIDGMKFNIDIDLFEDFLTPEFLRKLADRLEEKYEQAKLAAQKV